MGLYQSTAITAYLEGLAASAASAANAELLSGFLGLAADHLEGLGTPQGSDWAGQIRDVRADPAETVRVFQSLTGEARFVSAVTPVAVNGLIKESGPSSLGEVVGPPRYPRLSVSDLGTALQGLGDLKRVAVLAAAERQSADWERLESVHEGIVPIEMGALAHSGGDFDAVMMLLTAQGLAFRPARSAEEAPLLVAALSRSGNVGALRYTAGIQNKGRPIHKLPQPLWTTAYSLEEADDLTRRFLLHFFTQPAGHMREAFTPMMAQILPYGALVVYSIKSFAGELDPDELMARTLSGASRADVGTAYIAGYTGAGSIFSGDLPSLPGEGMRGLHLGIGTTQLERGLALASLWTGVPRDQADVMTLGGVQVHTFKNLSLTIPLIVSVYDDPDLRRTQTLYSIYKNVYSGIIGRDMFKWIWSRLNKSDGELTGEMISEAEAHYASLVTVFQRELLEILTRVEGIPADRVQVLQLTLLDAVESWRIKDMGLFFRLVKNLFFTPFEEGTANPDRLTAAKREWKRDVVRVFATRNPVAGAAIAAGVEAVRFRLLERPSDLIPEEMTFEGLNTALHLDARLDQERMSLLPQRVKDFIEEARFVRQPQVVPPIVRRGLANLASFLLKRLSGQLPSRKEAEVFLGQRVTEEEASDTMRWRGTLQIGDFVKAVEALRRQLEVAKRLISGYGPQHARLAASEVASLDEMMQGMSNLARLADDAHRKKPLTPEQLQMLIYSLLLLVVEGNRIYAGESFKEMTEDLKSRLILIFAYLIGEAKTPYSQGHDRFIDDATRAKVRDAIRGPAR